MAGVTDTVFRRVIRSLGACGLIMTEFTSAEGMTRNSARTLRYLYFDEDEHPIAGQIFGSDPEVMASAAALIEDLGFDQADINLGCPVKKVVKCGGSGLLRDLPHLENLFRAVRAAVRIPLTIKIRSGWDENNIVAVDVARMAEEIGIEADCGSSAHAHAGLRGFCRLEHDPRREAGGAHSRDRQWRYSRAAGRRAHDRGNRMRCRDDRPRLHLRIPGFSARSRTSSPPAVTTSPPRPIATSCSRDIFRA